MIAIRYTNKYQRINSDVNGSNTVNNEKYSGNFHADLVYSNEEAYQKNNTIDTNSSLDLDCYDHYL
jgi:hypothetical protein